MAINLSSPKYSFVQIYEQYNEPCAYDYINCLPVYNLSDIAFQATAEVTGGDKATFSTDHVNAGITTNCASSGVLVNNWIGTWTKVETGAGSDPDIWIGDFKYHTNTIFTGLDVGTCFNIIFYKQTDQTHVSDCTYTCFTKIADECFTSTIQYSNNSNAFYFDYSDATFYNKIRLPFYLHSPTFAEENKSYQKSDGSSVLLFSRIWKDYKVKTDYMLDNLHEKFQIATAHSNIIVACNYSGISESVIRTEKIEVAWIEEESPLINVAQAKTTFRIATPVQSINSNCG
jgi:hypothetical protein